MYTDYFGFHDNPFNVISDLRFFFETPAHQQAYANLRYGIHERKGFLILTGEAGTGKTTLLHRLMKNLDEGIQCVFLDNPNWTFEELLGFICTDFGLPTEETGRLQKIQALKEFLQQRAQAGGTGVLLIDEAQNLEDQTLENLRLLLNLETPNEKLLQIVLAGQPELKLKLAQTSLRQLKQRIAIQCQLSCLREPEIGPFIRHRLRMAECDRPELFPPEVIQLIAAYSHGIPRLVNVLCDNALLSAYRAAKKTVSVEMIEEVAQNLELDLEPGLELDHEPAVELDRQPDLRLEAGPEAARRGAGNGNLALPKSEEHQPQEAPSGGSRDRIAEKAVEHRPAESPAAVHIWPGLRQNRLLQRRIGILLAFFLLIGVGAVFAPQSFTHTLRAVLTTVTTAELTPAPSPANSADPEKQEEDSSLDFPQPTAQQEIVEARHVEASLLSDPLQASSPASEWKDQLIVIEPGTTIYGMVLQAYGEYGALALDLLKEFNPHIQDLDIIRVGETLVLPPLTRETLLREQADGSYHLILASFHTAQQAQVLKQAIRRQGFTPETISRRVSKRLVLHRVEITGLQDPETIDQAWDLARTLTPF